MEEFCQACEMRIGVGECCCVEIHGVARVCDNCPVRLVDGVRQGVFVWLFLGLVRCVRPARLVVSGFFGPRSYPGYVWGGSISAIG
jgi:hypothetical protein